MKLPITLIPAPDEPLIESIELFDGCSRDAVGESGQSLRIFPMPGRAAFPLHATFWETVILGAAPVACSALGAWLASRGGRKVRLKIGDIEVEAHTREEVESLLAHAQEIQQQIAQRNQPPNLIP